MNASVATALKDCIPYRLMEEAEEVHCRWLYLADENFVDPFFDETISKCRRLAENSKHKHCVSNTEVLQEWAKEIESVPPAAIIFHVSRCGSTMLSQLLAIDPANIVLSEVPFFDELLRRGFRNNAMPAAQSLLQDAVSLYSARRKDTQLRSIIKADSWHIHFYSALRQLYPQIPFILLYRRPDEVVRSQQKKRGMQAIPGLIEPALFGFEKDSINYADLDGYMARVLETYFTAFIKVIQEDKLAFAFNYKEGMMHITEQVLQHCGLELSEAQRAAMNERSARHAKFPDQVFAEEAITEEPPPYLAKAMQLYDELDKLRLTHQPTS